MKTLKDIKLAIGEHETIRKEAIEWIKEDFKEIDKEFGDIKFALQMLELKWMKRLNISEEDLK